MAKNQFRPTTPEEHAKFDAAPAWTKAYTGDCKHDEVHVYKDGVIECSRCGLCITD